MRRAAAVAAVLAALVAPAAASAHPGLVRTDPTAGAVEETSPPRVVLTFAQPVEPEFSAVSVTNAAGERKTTGAPQLAPGDSRTLVAPVGTLAQGWYLVYWRAVATDGHGARGAFTFAVGPNPGPAPAFVVPSTSESTPASVVVARWIALLAVLAALGLLWFRLLVASRAVTVACAIATGVALVAIPVYVELLTAHLSLLGAFDLGDVVPRMRDSAVGRRFLDLELGLALVAVLAAVAVRLCSRVAGWIALAVGAAALLAPAAAAEAGADHHAAAVVFAWLHLGAAALWIGGVAGVLLVRRVDPRVARAGLGSILVVLASGIAASAIELPSFSSLWDTSYGQALLVKAALFALAAALWAWKRLNAVQAAALAAAVLASAVLVSVPAPKSAAATAPSATVGPGPVAHTAEENGYRVELSVDPNRAAVPNRFDLKITKDGEPVRDAKVTAGFSMLDMEMGRQSYPLPEVAPGVYRHEGPALVMVGRWGLEFEVDPPDGPPFAVTVVDHAGG